MDTTKIPKKFHAYKEWLLDFCPSGSIFYCKDGLSVYCTPDWSEEGMISIDVRRDDAGDVEFDEISYEGTLTPTKWFKIVKTFLDKYSKAEEILSSLSDKEIDHAKGWTEEYSPFARLHDVCDANEYLPPTTVDDCNAIMDAFNKLFKMRYPRVVA